MEFEKRSSKRSFLQLFEWNAKSRKKLFSNKSESSEKSKQGKENSNGSAFSLHQVHRNGCTAGSDIIENYSLSNPSSPNEDTMYGTKAPGVVARLMGLDSLPTSDVVETSLTPVLGSESFRASQYPTGFPGFRSEEHITLYDGMRNKLDGFAKDPMELMLHKVQNRPIERFQTEVLPPKSAKPISITHHRLLSPIKSPGFIRTMDADYLMEAAAKIIEQSPRSMINQKFPSLGLSSVPLRMQDIKEKVEMAERSRRILQTSQKDKEQRFTRYVNRQSSEMAPGQAEGMDLPRASGKPKTANSEDSRRIKSTSLSVQAKPNVLKRDGASSVESRSSANKSQPNEVKHSFVGRNLEKKHKNVETEVRTSKQSNLLRQNKQKQNSEPNEVRDSFRRSLVNEKERKQPSSAGFSRSNKTVNRIVVSNDSLSKRTNSLTSDSRKDHASAVAKKSLRKKEVSNRNRVSDGGNFATSRRDEGSNNCNYEIRKSNMWDSADGKNGMDVVSFTFNSPIKKPTPECTSSGKSPECKRSSFVITDSRNNQSGPGLDVAGGDALSILLEQKLKELAFRVESSQQDQSEVLCSSADSSQCSVSINAITGSNSSTFNSQLDSSGDRTGISFTFGCSSSSSLSEPWPESTAKWQGSNEASNRTVPLYSESGCKSLDTSSGISSKGSKQWSSVETLETCGWSSSRNSQGVDVELLDSASSTSLQTSISDNNSAFTSSTAKESSNWELYYIRSVLSYATLTSEELALGQSQKLIAPYIFDLLEDEKAIWNQNMGENVKFPRKVLFDCVEESLQLRCTPLINKGSKHWMKLTMLSEQTDWLSEELYREISGWASMEELMVDELVEKDMSTQLGRWVDFETEAFEEGIEIEEEILTSLFDELISEFFLF